MDEIGWGGWAWVIILLLGMFKICIRKSKKQSPLPQEKYGTEQAGNPEEAAGEGSAQDEGERGVACAGRGTRSLLYIPEAESRRVWLSTREETRGAGACRAHRPGVT